MRHRRAARRNSWALLVLMMAGIVIMWALDLARDAGYLTPNHDAKHT